MTVREQLLREIEAATDRLLVEVLDFLQRLKTQQAEAEVGTVQGADTQPVTPTPSQNQPASSSKAASFSDFFGILKHCPSFTGDPVILQRTLRSE